MRVWIASLLFLAGGIAVGHGAELYPFVTDGCTRYRDGTRDRPTLWRHCCVRHDLAFWAGGSGDEREAADRGLRDCVAATGARGTARLMYLAVRIGAHSPRKIAGQQWGNAWAERSTRRSPLTPEEIDRLEHELADARYDSTLSGAERHAFIRGLRERGACTLDFPSPISADAEVPRERRP